MIYTMVFRQHPTGKVPVRAALHQMMVNLTIV